MIPISPMIINMFWTGLALGLGLFTSAVIVTLVALGVLQILSWVERGIRG